MRVMAVGTIMVDVMAVGLPAIAEPGDVVYTSVDTDIGGHPIDVAIDLIRLGRDPATVAVVAAVGSGLFGDHVRRVMSDYGMPTFLQEVESADTGRNLVLSVQGEDRRFHLDPGANWHLETAHVASALESWAPDFLTIRPGYSGIDLAVGELLSSLEDVCVMLDLMQPHPARAPHYLDDALSYVDVIHCNRREALINAGTSNLHDAVERFLGAGVRLVLVTDGAGGAHAYTPTWAVSQGPFQMEVVDATGCGDAFCAGAIEWLEGPGVDGLEDLTPEQLTDLLLLAQGSGVTAASAPGCIAGVSGSLRRRMIAEQGPSLTDQTSVAPRERSP